MYSSRNQQRKRQAPAESLAEAEPGALVLSGDAAQVDLEEQIPIWKQEVVDERGRKRLHGAFTGGYSAGYFNTVGSKEGWTPTTFVSSRTARYRLAEKKAVDFMDEEDLADIVADRELRVRAEIERKAASNTNEDQVTSSQQAAQGSSDSTAQMNDPRESNTIVALINKQVKRTNVKPYSQVEDDDDLDGYDIGPKIKYDQTLTKKKKKKSAASQHVFQPKKVLSNPAPEPETIQSSRLIETTAIPKPKENPQLPSIGDWQVTKEDTFTSSRSTDNRRAPKAASDQHILKDKALPPWQQPEVMLQKKIPPWRQKAEPTSPVASVGKSIALLALKSTFTPYTNNPAKHQRYQEYLRVEAELERGPHQQGDLEPDTWRAECDEFKKCAMMYKPMTTALSQKFTSSVHKDVPSENEMDSTDAPGSGIDAQRLQAARDGKYGHLTRSTEVWSPAKLLCRRYDVLHPEVVESKLSSATQEPSGTDMNRSILETLMKTI